MPARASRRELGLLLLAAAAACGCAPFGPGFTGPFDVDDPVWLSPEYRRFHEPVLPRLVPVRPPQPVVPRSPRLAPVPAVPGEAEPFELPVQPDPQPRPQPTPRPADPDNERGPQLGPQLQPPERGEERLDLAVAAPTTSQAGSSILFEIRITNRSAEPVSNVVLEATLEDGLRLPDRLDRRVVRPVGVIAPGQSREAALTLVANEAGTRCASFLVTVDGRESGWKRVCVEVVPRQLELSVTGPEQAAVGTRATFSVTLANVTETAIEGVELLVSPDAALKPVGGSAGARSTAEGLRWNLGRLAAGERVAVEIECVGQAPAERACVGVQVTAEGATLESAQHCFEITAERPNPARRERLWGDWHRRWAAGFIESRGL
jgi:hypothetical protein